MRGMMYKTHGLMFTVRDFKTYICDCASLKLNNQISISLMGNGVHGDKQEWSVSAKVLCMGDANGQSSPKQNSHYF